MNNNKADVVEFEKQMRRKVHYVIEPSHLWNSIAELAKTKAKNCFALCKMVLNT
jgi:hypothetical protein